MVGTMYAVVMGALMLFPWLPTWLIAPGSLRIARNDLRRARGAGQVYSLAKIP